MTQTADARWTFFDATETWVMPINPNQMGPGHAPKEIEKSTGHNGTVAVFKKTGKTPKEWTFGGVIRTEAHHNELERWARKKKRISVSTHLGQVFEVIIQAYSPEDRRPTPNVPWRMQYTMTCLVLRQVS